jgi:DNA adenine methylase
LEQKTAITPFLKWVGGKRQLIEEIKKRMPNEYNNYFEPFVGGGALFMELQNPNTTINDYSSELVDCYLSIKYDPEKLMTLLDEHERKHALNPEEYYYQVRALDREPNWKDTDRVIKASRMIYLYKTFFNGLYRVNSKGYFNVPFNGKLTVNTYNKENIMALHDLLVNDKIVILNGDFEKAIENAKAGDFIFFDPPYDVLKSDTFDAYTKDGFGVEGQKRLAKIAHELSDKGCYVMITNHNTELINSLYKDFHIDVVNVKRMINSDASNRVGIETIIYNY